MPCSVLVPPPPNKIDELSLFTKLGLTDVIDGTTTWLRDALQDCEVSLLVYTHFHQTSIGHLPTPQHSDVSLLNSSHSAPTAFSVGILIAPILAGSHICPQNAYNSQLIDFASVSFRCQCVCSSIRFRINQILSILDIRYVKFPNLMPPITTCPPLLSFTTLSYNGRTTTSSPITTPLE